MTKIQNSKLEIEYTNHESRVTGHESQINKGFTLIELVVAVALLVMMLSFSGVIFKGSIGAHRAADASADIMQKLRAITDQLNADFKGLRADAPLLIWFRKDKSNPAQRYDEIMFFADGDFQSTQLYESGPSSREPIPIGEEPQSTADKLIRGNVARIFYGQAKVNSSLPWDMQGEDERKRILGRRRHILSADSDLEEWPDEDMSDFGNGTGADKLNERYEHDSLLLAQWKIVDRDAYKDKIIPTCFGSPASPALIVIDMDDAGTFHKLMCEGVSSFAVRWAYWDLDDDKLRWFPSDDPDGSGTYSHFDSKDEKDMFGVFFNIPDGPHITDWYHVGHTDVKYNNSGGKFQSDFYPRALKFTFRLYDSRGVIKEGREFTHIVYLGD